MRLNTVLLNGLSEAPVEREGPLATGVRLRPLALALLTGALLALCALLTIPFLPAVSWAVAFAIIAAPMHRAILRGVRSHGLAAAISTLVVILVLVVPGCFVAYHLALGADASAKSMEGSADSAVKETLASNAALAPIGAWLDRLEVNVDREVRSALAARTGDATALIAGSVQATVQFAICLFLLFHLLRDRDSLAESVRRLLPMSRAESERVFHSAADSVQANLHATLVTSVIDGVGGGLMFWALGIPSPLIWGVVMFVLSTLPIVGTFLVWMPAAAYLAASGQWPGAVALVAWGVGSWLVVDNLIYVRIAGHRMRLHQIPALIAFLGGLALFGASGIILGPAILAVTVAILDVWRCRASTDPANSNELVAIPNAQPT